MLSYIQKNNFWRLNKYVYQVLLTAKSTVKIWCVMNEIQERSIGGMILTEGKATGSKIKTCPSATLSTINPISYSLLQKLDLRVTQQLAT
jgi:hypothetical protein